MMTRIKPIDAMVFVGCGQRELIIGGRQTGKPAVTVNTNQKHGKGGKDDDKRRY